jgi:ribose-phosphate pyrophosphokinase
MSNVLLFSGGADSALALRVAEVLSLPLGDVLVSKFKDGETRIQYMESVQGKDVFLLQSTSAPQDTRLMELLLLADGAFRGAARSITAIVPYFAYARQDRIVGMHAEPVAAKLIAKLLRVSGIQRFVTINLHSDQVQGFFEMPVHNLQGHVLFIEDIKAQQEGRSIKDFVFVSPDAGSIMRASDCAKKMNNVSLAFVNKSRSAPNKAQALNVVGDVTNKNCIIIDDMIDTGGTLMAAASALKAAGASSVVAYCVHPVLSDFAVDKIENSSIDELVVTDTILLSDRVMNSKKIRQISIVPMISKVVAGIIKEELRDTESFSKKMSELQF